MNGVEGALELAASENNPVASKAHLEDAMISAKRMTHLVDTILEYSEIQADKTTIELQPFSLSQLIKPLGDQTDYACRAKSIEFKLQVQEDLADNLSLDARALTVVLAHILDNGVKFTSKGSVSFDIYRETRKNDKDVLVFSIKDTGIGIDESAIKDIFTPFQQLDGSFSRGYGGLGIGLSICNELAIKMDGDLQVFNQTSQGTEFKLSIPYLPCELSAQQSASEKLDSLRQQIKKQILVVEDNLVNQKILVAILKKLNQDVLVANDGVEALQVLEKEPVAMIFMDCQMPNMDGFETTARIRKFENATKDIPIVAVTANAMSGDKARCLDAGMNDYVKKPINRAIVETKLKQWCA